MGENRPLVGNGICYKNKGILLVGKGGKSTISFGLCLLGAKLIRDDYIQILKKNKSFYLNNYNHESYKGKFRCIDLRRFSTLLKKYSPKKFSKLWCGTVDINELLDKEASIKKCKLDIILVFTWHLSDFIKKETILEIDPSKESYSYNFFIKYVILDRINYIMNVHDGNEEILKEIFTNPKLKIYIVPPFSSWKKRFEAVKNILDKT